MYNIIFKSITKAGVNILGDNCSFGLNVLEGSQYKLAFSFFLFFLCVCSVLSETATICKQFTLPDIESSGITGRDPSASSAVGEQIRNQPCSSLLS